MRTIAVATLLMTMLAGCGSVNGPIASKAMEGQTIEAQAKDLKTVEKAIKSQLEKRYPNGRVTLKSLEVSATPLGHTFTFRATRFVEIEHPFHQYWLSTEGTYNVATKMIVKEDKRISGPDASDSK